MSELKRKQQAVDSGDGDSCEGGMKGSQGSTDSITDNGRVPDNGNTSPSASGDKQGQVLNRRRSKSGKRRSGFSRGRVSITQLSRASAADSDTSGSGLCNQIPVEMPAAERLCLLTRLHLRYAVEVLDAEFADVPGFHNFKAEAVERVGAAIDQMEGDGYFEQACTTTRLTANPVNIMMDSTIASLTSCIKGLENEDAAWDELVSTLERQAQDAEQQLSRLNMEYSDIPERVKELSQSFLPNWYNSPDLSAMCANTVRDVKTISLLMEDYCQSVELLNIVHRATGRHMDSIIRKLDEANHCRQCNPKKIIQQMLAI